MALADFEFKEGYNRYEDDIANDFYIPCLSNSVKYDRITGYFGSSIYILAWRGLKPFIAAGGRIRIICSPIISNDDWDAIEEGSAAHNDVNLAAELSSELDSLLANEDLNLPARLLACLIANGTIQIRVGIVVSESRPDVKRLFHDKMGSFIDANDDCVCFWGSVNETYKGISFSDGNIESCIVCQSWDTGKDRKRAQKARAIFENVWSGEYDDTIWVRDVPDEFIEHIRRQASRDSVEQLIDEIRVRQTKFDKWQPSNSERTPRKHQANALENWEKNGHRGILKHATGSGKTFTAICAINYALNHGKSVLVYVPSKELLYQWRTDIEKSIPEMNIDFLLCGDGNALWRQPGILRSWTRRVAGKKLVTIAMMTTAATSEFIGNVSCGNHLMVVADEVHEMGSVGRRILFGLNAGWRLGLSATPERYGDEKGTNAILDYFEGIIKPEYTLADAIAGGVLTRYFYYPQLVSLTETEQAEWDGLSSRIGKMWAAGKNNGMSSSEIMCSNRNLQMLLIKRARILKNARAKVDLAVSTIVQNYKVGQRWIVYCDNQQQMNSVYKAIADVGINAYTYYADMPGDREATLAYFEQMGGIVISIRCLDEGVDIPSTTHAMILASSKNPREFIQRRGRVLRQSDGKSYATIYDAIVLPNGSKAECGDKRIVFNELARAIQFGEWAENPLSVAKLKSIAIDYDVNYAECLEGGFEDEE